LILRECKYGSFSIVNGHQKALFSGHLPV
jgi:hypothetical protein